MGGNKTISMEIQTGSDEFENLTAPYRHELLVHCYRFLGSIFDAEDALQETLLRAWRRFDSVREQSALRAWMYRIATNVCLDTIEKNKSRSMPDANYPAANPGDALLPPLLDPVWLEPLPDELIGAIVPGPEARYETRESVSLAFLTVIQQLPARQRAVLILRDVLGWKAEEVADLLSLSVAAANSALQRARTTMNKHQQDWAFVTQPKAQDTQTESLLFRYRNAWENADHESLVSLLREDAILTMPPLPTWYRGRLAISGFYANMFSNSVPSSHYRLRTTSANGSPAFAVYQQVNNEAFNPVALQVLKIVQAEIIQIDTFLLHDSCLMEKFGLPISF